LVYKVPDTKLSVIHNGVDAGFWDPDLVTQEQKEQRRKTHQREGKNLILYYGHAGKSKGIDTFIEAIPGLLKQENAHIICNIIPSKRSKKIIETLKMLQHSYPKKITLFEGIVKEDLRVLVATADHVIAPSRSE
jgi:glycosyltransferase involved in cell wall biosynthesis